MVNVYTKKGFSLAEALISMLVISVFFIVASKVMTMRPKTEYALARHGYYECYKYGGNSYQKRVDGTVAGELVQINNKCQTIPPAGIPYVTVYLYHNNRLHLFIEPHFTDELFELDLSSVSNKIQNLYKLQESSNQNGIGDKDVFKQNLEASYSSSSIYQLLKNNGGNNLSTALFMCW